MRNRIGSVALGTLKTTVLALGVMLAAGGPGLAAQDMSGTWVFSIDLGSTGAGEATFVIEQDGDTLSGTYSGALGKHEIHGTLTGFHVRGSCEYGQLGSGTFEGRKQP